MRRIAWILLALSLAAAATADNWPAWRGADGTGRCRETGVPVQWSATENVRWKTPLPGPGNSTPIVWGDRIFLTQSLDEGGKHRALLCFDRKDGKLLWQQETPFDGQETTHKDNPYCSASPVTDGERVVASLGSAGVVCCDFQGKLLWRRDLGRFEHIWGNAASPVIYRDLVILNCGPGERQFLLAMDKRTGKDVWNVDEPGGRFGQNAQEWVGSWTTPMIHTVNGRDELTMSWPGWVRAYNPLTGALLWSCQGLTNLVYTSPLLSPDAVVAMSGYGGSYLAVRPGGSGDVTQTHRLWHVERAPQRIGSGVILGEHVYMANEPGTAQCIDLKTGNTLWTERLGSSSWGTLVLADGKFYVTNLQGETFVFAAKPTFELIGRNPLGERTLASIAISNGDIFIRTYKHLWCVASTAFSN